MTRTIWDGDQALFEVRVPAWSAVSADTLEADTTFIGGQYSTYGPYGRVLYTHGLGLDSPLGVVRLGYSFGDGATNWNGPQDLVLYRNWRGIPNAGTWTDGTTSAHCSNLHPSLCVLIRYAATSTTTYYVPSTSQPDSGWFGTITTQDPDGSGELYKRNRYYDPTQGRFTQEDPLGLAGGLNAYGFAKGDPVNYSDPFGLSCAVVGNCTQSDVAGPPATGMAAVRNLIRIFKRDVRNYGLIATLRMGGTGPNPVLLGAAAGMAGGSLGGRGAVAEEEAASTNPLAGTTYTPKVKQQMMQGDYHSFPSIIDQFAGEGTASTITGGDGTIRSIVQLPDAVNGKSGNYTWIIEPDGTVNHRLFQLSPP